MKEETDLRAVKALAHAMLELDIEQTRLSPLVVKHPFTDNGISGVRKPDGSLAIADLLNKPDDLALWRKQVGSVIDEADSAVQIYMMVTKSYALGFLKFARNSLSEKDFAELLADAWIRTEAPNNDPNLSKRDLLSLFKATDPTLLMDEEDYVYRDGQREKYWFDGTPENIASFLMRFPDADQIILTDRMDMLVLNTIGTFIDTCPDRERLSQVLTHLAPMQMGGAEPKEVFCPSDQEVNDYCNQLSQHDMTFS